MAQLSHAVFSESVEVVVSDLVGRCLKREVVFGLDGWRANGFYKIFRTIKDQRYKRIFVCGAGTHTEVLWPLLTEVFGSVDGVIDREPTANSYRGVPLQSRAEYKPVDGDAVILSSASFEEDMFRELRQLYGTELPLYRLYSDDSWIRFCEEEESLAGHWEVEYGELWEATRSPDVGGGLNASGFGFVLAYDYAFIADRLFPKIEVEKSEREQVAEILNRSFSIQLEWISEVCHRGRILLLETYALGDHVIQPVLRIVGALLDSGYVDQVLVLVSDKRTKDFFGKEDLDERWIVLDWTMSPFVGYFLPDLDDEFASRFERECAGLSSRLKTLIEHSRVEIDRSLRLVAGLLPGWLDELIERVRPVAFMNVLDNRPVSAAFYLTEASKSLPTLGIQHGFQTLALAPYWAKDFLGWKDAHSMDQYQRAGSGNRYHAVGNYFLRHLHKEYEASFPMPEIEGQGRLFVFVFQGPPYWHVTHARLLYALKVIKKGLGLLDPEWSVMVKLRSEKGRQLLEDYFGDLPDSQTDRISWGPGEVEGWKAYLDADAVGVLSSTAREEASFLGKPIVSLEGDESPDCLSFAHYGMSARLRNAEEFAKYLNELPRGKGSVFLNRDMAGVDDLLLEAFKSSVGGGR